MKKLSFFLISFFTGIALFIIVIRFVGWSEIKLALQAFTGWEGLIILGLTFLIIITTTFKWQGVLRSQGYRIPIISLFKPFLASHSINYLTPTIPFGGDIIRGYILKEKLKIPGEIAISSAIIDRILEITAHLTIIFLGVIYFLFKIGLPPKNLAIILGGGFLIAVICLFFFYLKSLKKESLLKFFFKMKAGNHFLEIEKEIFKFFSFSKISFWKGLILAFLRDGISICRFFVLLLFLGKYLEFLPVLSVFSFSSLVQLFPIPATLGSHEIVQAFVFGSLGLGVSTAAAFTMIIRGADLIFAIFGVFVLFRFGIRLIKGVVFQEEK